MSGGFSDAFRELGSHAGADTRAWTSYGIVEPDGSGGEHSVRFNDGAGNPLQHGVLIDVKLQPSGNVVPCRVANQCAGNGEGEYHPFGPGDEVLVCIPEGDERAGCVIIGRLNQSHDVFPTTVGGMDVTTNTFGFKRHIAPFIVEVGSGYTIRSAATGASLTVDQTGQWFLTDGDGSQLAMTADVVQLMTPENLSGIQMNVADDVVLITADTVSLVLDDALGSKFQSSNVLSISTCGNPGLNHVTTVEGVAQILSGLLLTLGTIFASALVGPVIGAELALLFNPGGVAAILNGTFALAGTPACTFTPYIPGIQAALIVPKIPGVNAGVGSPGFLTD